MFLIKYKIYIFLIISALFVGLLFILPNFSFFIFILYILINLFFVVYLGSFFKPSENIYSNLIESLFSSVYNVSQREDLQDIVRNIFVSNNVNVNDVYIFLEDDSGVFKLRSFKLRSFKLMNGSNRLTISKEDMGFIKFLRTSKYRIPFIDKRNTTLAPSYIISEINEYFDTTHTNVMLPIYTPDNDVVGLIFANVERIEARKIIHLSKLLNIVVLSFREIEMSDMRKIIEEDLKIAVDIQRKLVPTTFMNTDFFDSYGFYKPAYKVGGDYIDIIRSSNNFVFAVGDVSGKGVSAGLVTMIVKSILNSIEMKVKNFNSSVKKLNSFVYNWFYDQESTITFITLLATMFVPKKKLLYYVNAGHVPGIIVSSDGSIKELKATAIPIGIFENLKSKVDVVNVNTGDVMVLYTDGLIEQIDERGREFGIKRLESIISSAVNNSPNEIVDSIIEEFQKFSDSAATDDIAILIVKFK